MASSFLIVRSSQPKGIQGRRRDLAVKSWLKRCLPAVRRMLNAKKPPGTMENARLHEKPRLARAERGQGAQLPILVTKIQPPGVSSGLLDRPRLLALLPLVRTKQLTLIKAAAGFGKTSVALAWAERLRGVDT